MDILNRINIKILDFYDKICAKLKDLNKKKWFKPVLFIGLFLFLFISFLVFTYSHPIYEGTIWRGDHNTQEVNKNYHAYRDFFLSLDMSWVWILNIILILVVGLVVLYLCLNKRYSFPLMIGFMMFIAFAIRIAYMGYANGVFTCQHDVWGGYETGHLGLTFYIYYNNSVPPLFENFDKSYQFYHLKTAHFLFAGWMHIVSLFVGNNQYVLYESIKVISTFMSIMIFVLTYYILKELQISNRAMLLAMGLTLAFPILVMLGANTNNDTVLYFFTYLSIYLALKFYKNHNWRNTILLALSIGFTVSVKLSGALIAFPIAAMMIYVLVKEIKADRGIQIIEKYGVFALISLPIGLFWSIFNMSYYGYPLTYVWLVTNNRLLVDPTISFFDRILWVNLKQLFEYPFLILTGSAQDYNFFVALLKTLLFGEWNLGGANKSLFYFVLSLGLCFIIILFLLCSYFVMKLISKKKVNDLIFYLLPLIYGYGISFFFGGRDGIAIGAVVFCIATVLLIYLVYKKYNFMHFNYLAMASIAVVFLVSYVYFNMDKPFICTMDFRYVVPILIPMAYLFGVGIDRFIISYKESI